MVVFEIVAEGSDSDTADETSTPVRDRVEALGGRLTVESRPGHCHHRLAAPLGMRLAVLGEVEITALTRLCTAGSHVRPNLRKIR